MRFRKNGRAKVSATIPIKTISRANSRENRWRRSERVNREHRATAIALASARIRPAAWYHVHLVRVGPGTLDEDDNLPTSMKAIRDRVAIELGFDDSKRSPIRWSYDQRVAKAWGVEVTISSLAEDALIPCPRCHGAGEQGAP